MSDPKHPPGLRMAECSEVINDHPMSRRFGMAIAADPRAIRAQCCHGALAQILANRLAVLLYEARMGALWDGPRR